ncbi:MAG: T9SS type A sorting domain-containing protein [Chlorobi bacterium]|nr:T9SS type A sorting domain-containing protein [Chlorobiota bacterium]
MTRFSRLLTATLMTGIIAVFSGINLHSQDISPMADLADKANPNFFEIQKVYNDHYDAIPQDQRRGWKQFKRWEYFWQRRVNDKGEFPSTGLITDQFNSSSIVEDKHNKVQSSVWELLGPEDTPSGTIRGQGIGRINVVRFFPGSTNLIWAGSASGGVWKSTDRGQHWKTFPFTQTLSLGVSDIAVAPTNKNVVYVVTGDVDPAYGKPFYSAGLIKTTNGGTTWSNTSIKYDLHNGAALTRILIHPDNSDVLILASSNGIYKSTDAGETWSKNASGAYFRDMEFSPAHPNIIHAVTKHYTSSAIYRSTNTGDTWTKVKQLTNSSRIALAVTPADTEWAYALAVGSQYSNFHSMLRTEDEGETWEEVASIAYVPNILGRSLGTGDDKYVGQGTYDLALAVSPQDEELVFVGGINVWMSESAGENFVKKTEWYNSHKYPYVHADQHDLMFQNNTEVLYSANDGGLAKTTDMGRTWVDISKGMSITQIYKMGVSQMEDNTLIIGSQDNGTSKLNKTSWDFVQGGDGMDCEIDPTSGNFVYASLYYGNLTRSSNGGGSFSTMLNTNKTKERGPWVTIIALDPTTPKIIYAGYNNVWRSTNYGYYNTWERISTFAEAGSYSTITAIAVAPSDSRTIYAANRKDLWVTRNDGGTWTKLASTAGTISSITVDPTNSHRCWLAMSNYSATNKILQFVDDEMTNMSGNLPNVPVNSIVYQKDSPDRLYVGTDLGVYFSDYNSPLWDRLGKGLPNVVVNDMDIHYRSKKLVVATYGRGVWQTDLVNCNLDKPELTVIGELEFCSGDSTLMIAPAGFDSYLWTNGETTRTIAAKESGIYAVKVYDNSGCGAGSDGVEIKVNTTANLKISALGLYPACVGDTVTLSASLGFSTYEWSNGDEGRKIDVWEPGEYTVLATAKNGCEKEFTLNVEYLDTPEDKPVITQLGDVLTSTDAAYYQWYLNSEIIKGATDKSYEITEDGIYNVEIECGVMSEEFDGYVGVEDHWTVNKAFSLSPNPAGEFIAIAFETGVRANYVIEITNITGRKMISLEGISDGSIMNQKIDLQSLSTGVYFVSLRFGTTFSTVKFIKE